MGNALWNKTKFRLHGFGEDGYVFGAVDDKLGKTRRAIGERAAPNIYVFRSGKRTVHSLLKDAYWVYTHAFSLTMLYVSPPHTTFVIGRRDSELVRHTPALPITIPTSELWACLRRNPHTPPPGSPVP